MSEAPDVFRVTIAVDRPSGGMWHCGPNASWVTVTHLPTMTQARAYHRSQHKAREAAMACVQMMVEDCQDDQCSFPDAADRIAALEAESARLRDALTKLDRAVSENMTENIPNTDRLILDGEIHTGPAVDWAAKVLRAIRDTVRAALTKGDSND